MLAVNGGYFDIDSQSRLTPSGLLVTDGKEVRPINEKDGGSAVFFRDSNDFKLVLKSTVQSSSGMIEAVQAGPLLVHQGGIRGINGRDFDRQKRSVICKTRDSNILILSAVGSGLTLYDLADLLRASPDGGGFDCDVALNLDGGPSTQLSYELGGTTLNLEGLWKINNALVVSPL